MTGDGGKSWEIQPGINGKVLQALAYRGSANIWIAGRGGMIIKRTEQLTPVKFAVTRSYRQCCGRPTGKRRPRTPLVALPDDGDIPMATPPEKEN